MTSLLLLPSLRLLQSVCHFQELLRPRYDDVLSPEHEVDGAVPLALGQKASFDHVGPVLVAQKNF